MKLLTTYFGIIVLCLPSVLKAANPVVYSSSKEVLNVSPLLEIFEDKTGQLTFDQAIKMPFTRDKNKVPNFGVTESVFWIRIRLKNSSDKEHLVLDLSLPTLDKIDFFYPTAEGKYAVTSAGEQYPFYQRFYTDPDYLFDVNIPPGTEKTVYLKIASKEGIQLPITVGCENMIFEKIKNRDLLSGIYYGIMIAMILYNLFIYFSVRDKSYVYYVVYIVFVMLTQATIQGYSYQYLWPGSIFMVRYDMYIFPCLVGISGMEFMKFFLKVKRFSEGLSRFSHALSALYLISLALAFAHQYKFAFHLLEVTAMLVSVYMLSTSVIIMRKGYQPAKYFLAAWLVFLMGVCAYILKDFEILPFNNFTRYTMQIGSGVETVLLSFALAAKINSYKKEKEQSQAETLKLLTENERIIIEQKTLLEQKVKERTAELEETREQLVNTEKMASLGQLTAGISHEINNPINFVVSNVQPLKRDIKDILLILEKYSELNSGDDIENKLKEISKLKEELDVNYLLTEIDLLLKGIDEGATRTSEIVQGLKNFSRIHETELQPCDLHEGINSTLVILNNMITGNAIKVVKDYGDIPQVEGFPGKLNQVFMNLLNNAVYAIAARKYSAGEGTIIITTRKVNEGTEIRIKDNGIGIARANLLKLFDPFFTTKPVGSGTGLGLSIVYGIINSHNGTIQVLSEENEGAEFIIFLPFDHRRV